MIKQFFLATALAFAAAPAADAGSRSIVGYSGNHFQINQGHSRFHKRFKHHRAFRHGRSFGHKRYYSKRKFRHRHNRRGGIVYKFGHGHRNGITIYRGSPHRYRY